MHTLHTHTPAFIHCPAAWQGLSPPPSISWGSEPPHTWPSQASSPPAGSRPGRPHRPEVPSPKHFPLSQLDLSSLLRAMGAAMGPTLQGAERVSAGGGEGEAGAQPGRCVCGSVCSGRGHPRGGGRGSPSPEGTQHTALLWTRGPARDRERPGEGAWQSQGDPAGPSLCGWGQRAIMVMGEAWGMDDSVSGESRGSSGGFHPCPGPQFPQQHSEVAGIPDTVVFGSWGVRGPRTSPQGSRPPLLPGACYFCPRHPSLEPHGVPF